MADDSIRTLFDKVDGLTIQTTRIETLLVENVIAGQKSINSRLDAHSRRLSDLENMSTRALTVKQIFVWSVSTGLLIAGLIIAAVELIIK